MTGRVTIRHLGLAVLVGGILVMTSCSGSPSSANPGPPTSVVSPGASVPFTLANNARADVATQPCTQTASGWLLAGNVKNPAHVGKRFQIVVDFVSRVGSTVLATTVLNIREVAPGATATWSATGAKGKSDVDCVVRLAQSS